MAIFPGSAIPSAAADYDIDNSCRFNDNDSAYMGRTFSAGDTTSWTFSCWVKRGNDVASGVDGSQKIFGAMIDGSNVSDINFSTDDIMDVSEYVGGSTVGRLKTTQVFRDPSAWYHIVVVWDSDNGSSGDRYRLYVNGDRVTAFSTETQPSSAQASATNAAGLHHIGKQDTDEYYDGYLAEMYFIDGQSLTADSFGELSSTTNQWIPKDVSGLTFGTNGFYQKYGSTELATSFTDSSGFVLTENITANVLVVAGGGGGGNYASPDSAGVGGGGGAGGFRTATGFSVEAGAFSVAVGAGGAGASASGGGNGATGSNSTFSTITAAGGGGGGARDNAGLSGGSGGGAGQNNTGTSSGGSGDTPSTSPVQGYAGGNSGGVNSAGGGGGGASAVGANVPGAGQGGAGGAGTASSISGSSVTYSGGGGGGSYTGGGGFSAAAAGGAGGGGAGATDPSPSAAAVVGTANTGGGAGGGIDGVAGASGGSGIVIISYISATALATGGTITSYVDGSDTYQVHTFTSSVVSHTIAAVGDVTQTTAQKKIGSSSIYFDGTGDWLTTPDSSDWDFGADDFTCECWIRIPSLTAGGAEQTLICTEADPNYSLGWVWMFGPGGTSNDYTTLGFLYSTNGSSWADLTHHTTGLVADTWTHVAVVRATTTVTIYVAGSSIGTHTIGTSTIFNPSEPLDIGSYGAGSADAFQGYMDEIRISDIARYTGTFTPSTTAFTADSNTVLLIHSNWDGGLGADSSGNYNTFSTTNLVATDQMIDTPTNNFCTMNPLDNKPQGTLTLSEGNLEVTGFGSERQIHSTIMVSSGKWYMEFYCNGGMNDMQLGVANSKGTGYGGKTADSWGVISSNGNRIHNASNSSYGTSYGDDDIVMVALDMGNGKWYMGKNGTWYDSGDPVNQTNPAYTGLTGHIGFMVGSNVVSGDIFANFGQDSSFAGNKTAQGNQDSNEVGDFYYTPPSLFLALCTDNLPSPEIALPGENFNTILWTGTDGGGRAFTGVGFQPDFVWAKNRDDTWGFTLVDSVRGGNEVLSSDTYDAEATNNNNGWIDSFDSDGFTVIAGASNAAWWNLAGDDFVAWNWRAGTTFDPATAGTVVTGSGSSNATAGFSIVGYEGTGAAMTMGHGLGSAPELILVKNRDDADDWQVYCASNTAAPETDFLVLNTTAATVDSVDRWNDTPPSSTVFTVGDSVKVNTDDEDYIAYCFRSIEGYSKVGSYTGNGNTGPTGQGPFVYLGFRPAYLMIKCSSTSSSGTKWVIFDSKRDGWNQGAESVGGNKYLFADTTEAGANLYISNTFSNGFTMYDNYDVFNIADATYIYLAFAESPFKYSNAR